jgi:protein-disulfide isomerase
MSQSKRELRAERKAAREAAERAEAHAKARRRRFFTLGGVAGLAAAILVVAIAVSASGGSSKAPAADPAANPALALLAGIPENDGVLGDPDAKITLTEYLDPQCPICAQASTTALPHVIDTYVKTGKVKLKAATMSFLGPDSVKAAKFAAGAKAQGKQWAFLETFYASQGTENSGYVTDEFLDDIAKAAGVDAEKAHAFAGTQAAQDELDSVDGEAQTLGVNSTPTFVMTSNGTHKIVAVGIEDLQAKLDEALS